MLAAVISHSRRGLGACGTERWLGASKAVGGCLLAETGEAYVEKGSVDSQVFFRCFDGAGEGVEVAASPGERVCVGLVVVGQPASFRASA